MKMLLTSQAMKIRWEKKTIMRSWFGGEVED